MRMRSSMVTVAPMRPRSSTVVVTSFRCGTFATTTGSSASSAPARIGNVAFFAPEIRTSPSSATPPWICSLSTVSGSGLFRRQRLDRQRMDLPPDQLPQCAVDELVPCEGAQLRELARDDTHTEVSVIVGIDLHLCAGQT